ncbi:Rho termination factor N-terminal domain-containing protein [Clostridium sp. Cult2]|uniref:Rho termination factor N-terminal domain-containing protein n=1 Tax=Clostridium sp. Cult2 TaxID=2079003 RepID=UPI001EFFA8A0|nr:Rho termination factor N-terminal domain-containing protein [Clostridium sp. Cult2]MCF6466351.1 hypothetical protein [Clostridium sp. Cult2]
MSVTAFQRRRRELAKQRKLEEKKKIEDVKKVEDQLDGSNKLEDLKVSQLKEIAKEKGIEGYSNMKKEELIKALTEIENFENDDPVKTDNKNKKLEGAE